ncbi:MAG TPA: 16S rRNA (guanine(966)-N(2))-methyltransferase RsmD [Ignavibacteriales bacterium]|nr:16S rRNA (guanine(966)-N(2))-methyltransferase RsmD [Ignavibacteriales bacterium]
MRIRIISGIFKGRFINVPQSKLLRPTADRVKETLFNLLNNKIDFEGINVLELYAGSGSLGLECISRGAGAVTFVENNFLICKNLKENIKSLKVENLCVIEKLKAVDFAKRIPQQKFNLILADPPYFKDDIYQVVENFKLNNYLKKNGLMIIERSIETKSADIENFKFEPFKIIGDTCLYELYE